MTLPDDAPAKNAGTDDWAAYAKERGVEVPEGSTRSAIIEAVEAAEDSGAVNTGATWPPVLETKEPAPTKKKRRRKGGAYFSV
jgi:hypothetical protein